MASIPAILNTASGYAFGSVIAALPGFFAIKDALLHLQIGGGPLVSAILTTNVMTAVTGSASGGLTIALGMLGQEWLAWGASLGMSPEVLHRIVCHGLHHHGHRHGTHARVRLHHQSKR